MAHKEENDKDQNYERSEPSSKTDVDIDKELESEPLITEIDLDTDVISDFHAAYKAGNFGMKRGKLDLSIARRWTTAHVFVVLATLGLSIAVLFLMNDDDHTYWLDKTLSSTFTVWLVLYGPLGLVMSCCSLYLVRHLHTLRRPLFLLLLVRLLAILECVLLVAALVTTLFVVANAKDEDSCKTNYQIPQRAEISRPTTSWRPEKYSSWRTESYPKTEWPKWTPTKSKSIVSSSRNYGKPDCMKNHSTNVGTFRVLCVFLIIFMTVDWITAMMWLFHWWRCLRCFECFKSLAIFQPGEPLADGVSDPRNGIISECAYLCWRAYNTDCGTII